MLEEQRGAPELFFRGKCAVSDQRSEKAASDNGPGYPPPLVPPLVIVLPADVPPFAMHPIFASIIVRRISVLIVPVAGSGVSTRRTVAR